MSTDDDRRQLARIRQALEDHDRQTAQPWQSIVCRKITDFLDSFKRQHRKAGLTNKMITEGIFKAWSRLYDNRRHWEGDSK